MTKKRKTYMLALDRDDPEKELEFEVAFQLTLTERQRYTTIKKLVRQSKELLKKNDYKKTPAIVSRP